jgi:hypothetical protein
VGGPLKCSLFILSALGFDHFPILAVIFPLVKILRCVRDGIGRRAIQSRVGLNVAHIAA